jgi:hypothetical protein
MRGILPGGWIMLDKLFWTLVTIEGATVAVWLISFLKDSPKNSDHSLVLFMTMLPLSTLIGVAAVYRHTKSTPVHAALLVVPLLLTIPGLNAMYNDYSAIVGNREKRLGIGLFDDPGVSALLKAIGKQDGAQVRELARTVNVNAVAPERWLYPSPYTPLRFAVERAVAAERDNKVVTESREMVELLLSLGAKPSPALLYACRSSETELTRILLDAGADANYETVHLLFGKQTTRELPYYGCADTADSAMGNLELLAKHGARFTLLDPPRPWPMRTAILNNRWDQVLFLHDHGLPMETDAAMTKVIEDAVGRAGNPDARLVRVRQLVEQQQQ